MRRGLYLMVATLGVVAWHGAKASASIIANGVEWTYNYEGDTLPDDSGASPQAWTKSANAAGTASIGGGILTLAISGNTQQSYSLKDPTGKWSPSASGTTVEVRLKVDATGARSDGTQSLYLQTGSAVYAFQFGPTSIRDTAASGQPSVSFTTTDAYHTYRITLPGLTGTAELYADGSSTPIFSSSGGSTSKSSIAFGAVLSNYYGTVNWDYVRWTNAGAFPVPEPASMTLLALGGLVMLRRRR